MRGRAENAEIYAAVEKAAAEAEGARRAYDAWMADWRERHGHAGKPYDLDTGCPLAVREGA